MMYSLTPIRKDVHRSQPNPSFLYVHVSLYVYSEFIFHCCINLLTIIFQMIFIEQSHIGLVHLVPKLILCRRNNQMIFLDRALRKSVIHQVSPMIIRPSKLIRIPLNVAFVSYIRSFIHPFILSHEHTLWFILDIFL